MFSSYLTCSEHAEHAEHAMSCSNMILNMGGKS